MMFMHDNDPYGSFPLEPLPSVPVGSDKNMAPPSPPSSPTRPASHSTSLPLLPLRPLDPEAGSPAPPLPSMMLMMPTIGHHPSTTSPPFSSHYGPPSLPYPCPASTDSSLPCHCSPHLSYTAHRPFSMGTPPWRLCPSSSSSSSSSSLSSAQLSLVEAPSTCSASSQTTTGAKTSPTLSSADRRLAPQQQPQRSERRPPQYNHQRHTSYTPTVVAGVHGPTVHLQATPTSTSSAFGHLTAPKTSEWRMGPEGRGTLCNACGLRYRKKLKASLPPKAAASSAPNPISLLLNSDVGDTTGEVDD
ncbi:GATA zinc finger domain containing protein [Acanthamoeba castellanii str. Neff]|uniref:GATA zinc finger domain containing protein n=1 Tax=Acanthamoeba castellanii (strain ATCC 30010 / Neff) TaxID=1257118 RepID=L8H6G3_ACACF|nr:GATA zinc finger domain containing protein [Acanthamoeba castellanii str. Neff]ELR20735.1 GATA zinc finger domain containing protein [Acanthamoeba castellanii str. Neff]